VGVLIDSIFFGRRGAPEFYNIKSGVPLYQPLVFFVSWG
jgi:hypothetical protein